MRLIPNFLVCLLTMFILSKNAFSQDIAAQNVYLNEKPTDVFFQIGGSGRFRYENLFNAASGRESVGDADSNVTSQMGFWLRLNKGEYFQSFFNLLHVNNWGRQSLAFGDSNDAQRDSFTSNNGLFVNQAWGKWKLTDTIHIEFGRAPLDFGYGALFSKNSWLNHPYAVDRFNLNFDWEFLSLAIVGIKAEELSATSKDPEAYQYLLDLDFKNIFDYFKVINLSLLQSMRDQGSLDAGVSTLARMNSQRFSLETSGQANSFGHKAALSYVSGRRYDPTGEKNLKQFMLDAEVNYTLYELQNFKIWAGYHFDSGDDNLTDETEKTYDPLYYDIHENAGRMDLLMWGNLKYYSFGFSINIYPHWLVGSEFLRFEKSNSADGTTFGPQGSYFKTLFSGTGATLSFPNGESLLGTELDIFTKFEFLSGVRAGLILSVFKPGEVFTRATEIASSNLAGLGDNVFAAISQFEVSF